MAISTEAVGKRYEPSTYAVGREKIREYAYAVGETNPLHLDVEHAGPRATETSSRRRCSASSTAASRSGRSCSTRGRDRLRPPAPQRAGVPLGPTRRVGRRDRDDDDGQGHLGPREMGFYTFESVSTNQDGDTVCVGTWSNIVRGGEE
jgi:acyl dehydratase